MQGWDVLREKRLQSLKDLRHRPQRGEILSRVCPSVKAWDQMTTKERAANAARDMEVYAAMIDYMDEQIEARLRPPKSNWRI